MRNDTAILFAGHGTREPSGQQEFQGFVARLSRALVRKLPHVRDVPMVACYLELVHPSIESAITALYAEGIRRILLVPVFLFRAGHLKQDIPDAIARVVSVCPDLEIVQTDVVGQDVQLIHTAGARLLEAGFLPAAGVRQSVVLVGRGSSDSSAQHAFAMVAEELQKMFSIEDLRTCSLAGDGPRPAEVLTYCRSHGAEVIYLLPYLLFSGRLTRGLPNTVSSWQQQVGGAHVPIVIAHHLGAHQNVIDAFVRRVKSECPNRLVATKPNMVGVSAIS